MLSGQATYGQHNAKRFYQQNLVAPCPAKLLRNFRGFFSSIPPCVQELLSLKMESPLCLLHGKLPDPTLKPVIVTLRVHVSF